MKRILIPFLFAALTASAERENLWPEGKMPDAQPHQVAKMTNEKGDNAAPYIDWLPAPEKPNGCCMILISGGAYKNCCDVGLVDMWGKKFTAAGFQCVNLVYRTPRPKGLPFYQSAWEDGQRAVRLVRSQAVKRGFHADRIGTISMSAGSHLATLLATSALTPAYENVDKIDDIPCHLNWAITGAIGYALDDGLGVANARGGEGAKLDPVFQFDKKTAPMCMFHGSADPYSPLASTQVYRELRKRRIPAELHLFADRPHGFWGRDGRGDKACAYDNWFDRAMEFLRQLGWFLGPLPHEESLIARYPADFHDPAKYARENLWPGGEDARLPELPVRPVPRVVHPLQPDDPGDPDRLLRRRVPVQRREQLRGCAGAAVPQREGHGGRDDEVPHAAPEGPREAHHGLAGPAALHPPGPLGGRVEGTRPGPDRHHGLVRRRSPHAPGRH